jgi:hypothetical protein
MALIRYEPYVVRILGLWFRAPYYNNISNQLDVTLSSFFILVTTYLPLRRVK